MPLWSEQETNFLKSVRERLGEKLTSCPQYPEVVGDRKLLRFSRGHNYDLNKVCEMVEKFLAWRIANNIDAIREDIVKNNLDAPIKFPFGELILRIVPQVVIEPDATDILGNPISVETLVPISIWTQISVDNFMKFRLYCLEYVSLILEKISYEQEIKLKEKVGENPSKPYGCVAQLTILRCMKSVSLSAFTAENKEIAGKIITVASDNYPEVMAKCYLVNPPWIFPPIFAFVKLFLAAKTVAKIKVMGHDFQKSIAQEVPLSSVPDFLGGTLSNFNRPLPIDTSEGSPLWSPPSDVRALADVPLPAPTR